jgi:hypothetical protein
MIETIILEKPSARRRFQTAPFLEERERYLFHLMRRGFGPPICGPCRSSFCGSSNFCDSLRFGWWSRKKSNGPPSPGLLIAGRTGEE